MTIEEEFEIFIQSSFCVDEAGDIGVAVAADVFTYFESRTCENCKYYSPSKNIENYGVCTNDDIGCLYGAKPSFGCNKFERKN